MKGIYQTEIAVCLFMFFSHLTPAIEALVQPFVTPGIPACYVSRSQYEYVQGLSQTCQHTYFSSSYCGSGVEKYFYCSKDHTCCLHKGCPACCVDREYLNTEEVAGIVVGCIVLTFILLGGSYACAGRFCKPYNTS